MHITCMFYITMILLALSYNAFPQIRCLNNNNNNNNNNIYSYSKYRKQVHYRTKVRTCA